METDRFYLEIALEEAKQACKEKGLILLVR